jgi:hypothetical protein
MTWHGMALDSRECHRHTLLLSVLLTGDDAIFLLDVYLWNRISSYSALCWSVDQCKWIIYIHEQHALFVYSIIRNSVCTLPQKCSIGRAIKEFQWACMGIFQSSRTILGNARNNNRVVVFCQGKRTPILRCNAIQRTVIHCTALCSTTLYKILLRNNREIGISSSESSSRHIISSHLISSHPTLSHLEVSLI